MLIGSSATCVQIFNCENKENVLTKLKESTSECVYILFLTFQMKILLIINSFLTLSWRLTVFAYSISNFTFKETFQINTCTISTKYFFFVHRDTQKSELRYRHLCFRDTSVHSVTDLSYELAKGRNRYPVI